MSSILPRPAATAVLDVPEQAPAPSAEARPRGSAETEADRIRRMLQTRRKTGLVRRALAAHRRP
jgi:hypothetical protein